MISHLTRFLLLLQLLAVVLAAVLLKRHAWITSAWLATLIGLAVVLLVRAAITANNFRLIRRFPDRQQPTATLSKIRWLSMYLREFRATMISSSWSMPFRSLDVQPVIRSMQLPVLLVHGYGCNSGYWRTLSRHLRQAGISHHAVNLEPLLADIDTYVPQVVSALETLCQATGHVRVIVVGHSMGGLVMRAYQSVHGCERIARLITLGTPHRGTGLAQYGMGINARQMRWADSGIDGAANPWLSRLQMRESGYGCSHMVSIYSRHDNIVAPQDSSHVPGAKNIAFEGIGHVMLGSDRRVIECMIAEIRAAQALSESLPNQTLLADRR